MHTLKYGEKRDAENPRIYPRLCQCNHLPPLPLAAGYSTVCLVRRVNNVDCLCLMVIFGWYSCLFSMGGSTEIWRKWGNGIIGASN